MAGNRTGAAFAVLVMDRTVVARGDQLRGGNSAAQREQLVDVAELVASEAVFAARGATAASLRGVDRKVAAAPKRCVTS